MTTPTRLALWSTVLAAALTGSSACSADSRGWKPPLVVNIQTKEAITTLMPAWFSWMSDAEEGRPQTLLLRDGDFIFGGNGPFRYKATDGLAFALDGDSWSTRVGATTVTISLEHEDAVTWLSKATDRQLADLRLVALPRDVDADALSSLKRLAAANPSVDLLCESEASWLAALPLFRPRAVFAPDGATAETMAILASQPQVELLMMDASEPGSLEVLTKLPNLTHLIVGNWNAAKAGPIPGGLAKLRGLIIVDSEDLRDLSGLKEVSAQLEGLSLFGNKHLTDITGLARFPDLHTLILWGDSELGDLSSLASHQKLRWVSLPEKTTQEQFAAFVGAHTNLAILDMTGNEKVTSLSPLTALKNLEGLILHGPYEDLTAVQSVTTLRFLGISKKTAEASPDQVAALRKALPDAVIVTVSPVCLGSGWALLLVPVIAWLWIRRRTPARSV